MSSEELKKEWKEKLRRLVLDYPAGSLPFDYFVDSLFAKQQEEFVKCIPEEKDIENIKIPEGANIGEYRFCEVLRREGFNACIADIKSKLNKTNE